MTAHQMDGIEAIEVSETILSQLTNGGNGMARLSAMVGATHFTYSQQGKTTFHFKGSRQANMIAIEYTEADLYNITFYKFNRKTLDLKTVETFTEVYADQLQPIFTSFTGLDTHL